jgi:hypothetical protein
MCRNFFLGYVMSLRLCSSCLVNFLHKADIRYVDNVNFVFTSHKLIESVMSPGTFIFSRFDACCHSFYLSFSVSYIYNHNRTTHSSISIHPSLHFFIACCSDRKTTQGCRAEIRTRALPTELRCTLLSYAAGLYCTHSF